MSSVIAKIVIPFMRLFMNSNPQAGGDMIESVRKLDKMKGSKMPSWVASERFIEEGLPYEIYYKKGTKPTKVIYFLHGGGYIGRLNGLYRDKVKEFLKKCGDVKIVFIDYRTAPEYVYPCALEDAVKGWNYLLRQGYKEEDIITIGDSAGGNLNLALSLKLRNDGKKLQKAIVCISPWTDMLSVGDSYRYNYNNDPFFGCKKGELTAELLEAFAHCSLYSWCMHADRKDSMVSPVFADYKGFPPTMFTVGGHEMLLCDTMTIYENMIKEGVEAKVRVDDGMFHIYPLFPSALPEARKSFNDICAFIRQKFFSL